MHYVTNLSRQEVPVFNIELPEPAQVGAGVTGAKISGQSAGQILEQGFAITCFPLSPLLLLHNLPSNQPISDDLSCIHCARYTRACCLQYYANPPIQTAPPPVRRIRPIFSRRWGEFS